MINDILQSIEGVTIYPVISLFLFIVIFIYMLISVIRMNQSEIDYAKQLPLENNDSESLDFNNIIIKSKINGK